VYFFGGQIILLVRATINRQTIAQRRLQRRPYAAERHQRSEREPPPGLKPADERLVQHGELNAKLSIFCGVNPSQCEFIGIAGSICANDQLDDSMTVDGVHLSPLGYERRRNARMPLPNMCVANSPTRESTGVSSSKFAVMEPAIRDGQLVAHSASQCQSRKLQ